ncbi:MAG: universal stress protein [Chitinophagaceae bacterium]|nr:MAG: universal stress protein [Chitinophagaceae bacterium]
MKNILCLTDFSAASQKAVQYAAWLSLRCNASLTLLHAVQLHLLEGENAVMANAQTVNAQIHMAERSLHETCEHLQQKFSKEEPDHELTCDFIVREGLLIDTVKSIQGEGKFDFIIMGTTGGGADKLEDLMVGSNTVQIMENIQCPILAVPVDCRVQHLEKIIFASSYHERDYEAVAKIVPIAQCLNSQIHIVHVGKTDSEKEQADFKLFCRPIAQKTTYDRLHFNLITHEDTDEGLLTFVKETRGDMIALLAKEKGFVRKYFHQSIVESIAYHSKVPFLILHEDDL